MKLRLGIYGMDCAACSRQVESVLRKSEGVKKVQINVPSSSATIETEGEIDFPSLEKRLKRFGYRLEKDKIVLKTDPVAFENRKEEVFAKIPAIASMESNEKNVTLYCYPISGSGKEILSSLRSLHIDAEIEKRESGKEEAIEKEQVSLLRNLVLAVFLTVPLLWNPSPYFQFALATLILLFPARTFLSGAIRVFRGDMNMDVLIVTSTALVYAYSSYLAFTTKENIKLYFLCEGVLISLVLFGRYLEVVAKGESERSISGFTSLLPKKARKLIDNEETYVCLDEVEIGDIVLIKEGERVPVDGIVREGKGDVDESLLTGESEMIEKSSGMSVTGGTLLRSGELLVEVDGVGSSSYLEQMIDIVRQAEISNSPIQKLADKIVRYFVPSVILIACFVFCLWYFSLDPGNLEKGMLCASGVLLVSCPCALSLAIPTSIMVGCGRCSELGILFKNASSIEKMEKIKTIAFDKTGTLTYGGEEDERNSLRKGVVGSIERLSKTHKTVMISGDKREIAEKIGKEAGIVEIYAEIKAEQKAEVIKELKKGGPTMMVGDGVNDAPAMAVSDVSLSIQNAASLSRDTADIIILGDDISKVPLVFLLSKTIMRNIHENLLWATLYNLICIPLAGAGLINPSLASAAMSFSSIAVLLNALRLKKMKGEAS